jgi:hypothetical protein
VLVRGRVVEAASGRAVAKASVQFHPRAINNPNFRGDVVTGWDTAVVCDPVKSYAVHFLDSKSRVGATVELSGKQAGADVAVRLALCGQAATRLLDADGKPLARRPVGLDLVLTPGPHRLDRKANDKGELAADEVAVSDFNFGNVPPTDAEGRVTFRALIPGATRRIVELADRDDIIKCEFRAESGKAVKLPDVVRKGPGGLSRAAAPSRCCGGPWAAGRRRGHPPQQPGAAGWQN